MRKFLEGLGIKPKIIVLVTVLLALACGSISLIIGYRIHYQAVHNAERITTEVAWRHAHIVKALLQVSLDETRTLAKVFDGVLKNPQGVGLSRAQANLLLRNYIEQSPNIVGMSVLFEPNAYDGKDSEFAGQPGHDASGRFIPYWSRNAQGQGVVEPLVDYESSEYYLLPKQAKHEVITEPYLYPVQGKEVLMTTTVVPVLDARQNFVGMVTMDIDLAEFQEAIRAVQISGFEHAYISLYSANGVVVASHKAEDVGRHISATTQSLELLRAVAEGRPVLVERESSTLQGTALSYVAPVEIGNTGIHWRVVVSLAKHEALEGMYQLLWLILLVTLAALLSSAYLSTRVARLLVRPLHELQIHLQALAQGRLLEHDLQYSARDEVGHIVRAYQQLKHGVAATIDQANAVAAGDYNREVHLLSEQDRLGLALRQMTTTLREVSARNAAQDWLKTGQAELAAHLGGTQNLLALAHNVVVFLSKYVHAQVGLFYLAQAADAQCPQPYLKLMASYAYTRRKQVSNQFPFGAGLVGQAALEARAIVITELPEDYLRVQSGSGEAPPRNVAALPFLYENQVKGVIELGSLQAFSELQFEFLEQAMHAIAVAVNSAESRMQMEQLWEQSAPLSHGDPHD